MKEKKSILLLISAILGTFYSIYIINHFFTGIISSNNVFEQAGISIATFIVTPHIIGTVIATALNWVAYFKHDKVVALVTAILYLVSGLLFLFYIIFVLPSIVLSFIGYSNIKKYKVSHESQLYLN